MRKVLLAALLLSSTIGVMAQATKKVEPKKAEAAAKVDAAQQKVEAVKAQGDAANSAVKNAFVISFVFFT